MAKVIFDSRWKDAAGELHAHTNGTRQEQQQRIPETAAHHVAEVKRDTEPGVAPAPDSPYQLSTQDTEGPLVATWTDAGQRRHTVYTEREANESRQDFEAAHAAAVTLLQVEFPPVGP